MGRNVSDANVGHATFTMSNMPDMSRDPDPADNILLQIVNYRYTNYRPSSLTSHRKHIF